MTVPGADPSAALTDPTTGSEGGTEHGSTEQAVAAAGVRVVTGRLETEELAAIAVVVSAMSVTSRLEAEERLLTEGHSAGAGVWNDPVHCHPHTFEARNHCSEAAWRYSHR
ncbi:hypothetical protein M3F59_05435 [Brachybacterium muris]|uniref:hypothetical protein n=1 Tax=Brachybacterium muris TaxID=219301 RepID=UPI00223B5F24|nr:hypothetical protein [Brachybacterium muris]MCT2261072.1 hypothetical protein [Brachybacterium muris]